MGWPASSDAINVSAFTGARLKTSSPKASVSAFRTAAKPPPTGGSPIPREPTGVSGSGMSTAAHFIFDGTIEDSRRFAVVEAAGERRAISGIHHPFLSDRVRDAQRGPAQHLPAQSSGMENGSDVGVRHEVDDVILAGFEIHFDLGETGDIGMSLRRRADTCRAPTPRSLARLAPPLPAWYSGSRPDWLRDHRRCRPSGWLSARPEPGSCWRRRLCGTPSHCRRRSSRGCRPGSSRRSPAAVAWLP